MDHDEGATNLTGGSGHIVWPHGESAVNVDQVVPCAPASSFHILREQ